MVTHGFAEDQGTRLRFQPPVHLGGITPIMRSARPFLIRRYGMFSTIVVGTDGSDTAAVAVTMAAQIAHQNAYRGSQCGLPRPDCQDHLISGSRSNSRGTTRRNSSHHGRVFDRALRAGLTREAAADTAWVIASPGHT